MTRAGRILCRPSSVVVTTVLNVVGWSATANACPVCFAADERTRLSFFHTAVLLSALPLALFAGLAFWFWRELTRASPPRTDRNTRSLETPCPNSVT